MNCKAQFIVAATLIISLIIMSLAVSFYLTASQYQEFRYRTSKEILINIDKDFKRALTRILAFTTHKYACYKYQEEYGKINLQEVECADINELNYIARQKLLYWYNTLAQSFPEAGLGLSLNKLELLLVSPSLDYPQNISRISSKLEANLTDYGLYGWVSDGTIELKVTVIENRTIKGQEKQGSKAITFLVRFRVEREYGDLASPLSIYSYNFKDENTLAGWAILFLNNNSEWELLEDSSISLEYSAGGNYNATFKIPQNKIKVNYPGKYYLISLWIRDERGILVRVELQVKA